MPNEHTIAENLQRLVDAKDDIAAAIVAKDVTVPQGSGLEDFASLIGEISAGGGVYLLELTDERLSSKTKVYLIDVPEKEWTLIFGQVVFATESYKNAYFPFPEGANFYSSTKQYSFSYKSSITSSSIQNGKIYLGWYSAPSSTPIIVVWGNSSF